MALVNFYDEFRLDRDDSRVHIIDQLKTLKLQNSAKAARPSSRQAELQQQLEWINQAERVFASDASRQEYDEELLRSKKEIGSAEPAEPDWTSRAWNYYYVGDNGAAQVAARKAREQNPKSPQPYIVSSWIQLREDEYKDAKNHADEAFVLDELTEDSVDVQEVRGAVYHMNGDYDRAISSFDRALAKASEEEKPELLWRKSGSYIGKGQYDKSFEAALQGLSVGVPTYRQSELEDTARGSMHEAAVKDGDFSGSLSRYKQYRSKIEQSNAFEDSKKKLRKDADLNIERIELHQLLDKGRPGTYWKKMLIFVIAGLIFTPIWFQASAGAGVVSLLLLIALIYFTWRAFNQGKEYDQAIQRLADVESQLTKSAPDIYDFSTTANDGPTGAERVGQVLTTSAQAFVNIRNMMR